MSRPLFTKYGSLDQPPAPPFIITDFDLSRQSNVVFHVLGDDYKVASFGSRVSVKKINGILRNPETTLQDMIDFYKKIYIGANYGEPINFGYRNYSGDGYCVGMSIAVREGSPASVSIDFLEIDRHDVLYNPTFETTERDDQYDGIKNEVYLYVPATEITAGLPDVAYTKIYASSLQIAFSSRYSIANSRKNIIYYGNNPTQAALEYAITEENGNYAAQFNTMLEKLRIKRNTEVSLMAGQDMFPATVVQVTSTDQSANVNYIAYSISAILGI